MLLRTQNVQLIVRTSTGLEKVTVEILSQNCTLLHEFNTRGSGELVMGKKVNFLGVNFNSSYILKSSTKSILARHAIFTPN